MNEANESTFISSLIQFSLRRTWSCKTKTESALGIRHGIDAADKAPLFSILINEIVNAKWIIRMAVCHTVIIIWTKIRWQKQIDIAESSRKTLCGCLLTDTSCIASLQISENSPRYTLFAMYAENHTCEGSESRRSSTSLWLMLDDALINQFFLFGRFI